MSSLKRTKKLLVKIVGDKLQEEFYDGIGKGAQLELFILLSVPVSQQIARLTSLYFFNFSNDL